MRIARAPLRRLGADTRGATLVEFAIVAPVMVLMLLGLFDLSYQMYAQSILEGAVQKAGRDSAIEGGGDLTATVDGKVVAMIKGIVKNPQQNCGANAAAASWCSTRNSYSSFSAVKPEPFVDSNDNDQRDAGECFDDINGNRAWDADPGRSGQGGANDVTLYTFRLSYPRLFPAATLIGWGANNTIQARTLLKNQPYARQAVTTVASICT